MRTRERRGVTPEKPNAMTRRGRRRRGATIVLVTVLLVPLLGIAALVLDLGWWQVGATQLQNASDAAALAGARALQVDPANAATKVVQYAQSAGQLNKVFGTMVTVASADVEPIYYNPTAAAASQVVVQGGWTTANAVRVTVRQTAPLIFGGAAGVTAPTVVRSAVAWIANVNSGACVKPWALPYQALYDRVAQITGMGATSTQPRPDLTQSQLAWLSRSSVTEDQRLIIFRPPTYDGAGGNPDSSQALGNLGFNNGMYAAYNFTSPNGNNSSGSTAYQANISGCTATTVSTSTVNGATLPGSNDIPCLTVNALMGSNANNCNGGGGPNGTPWPWNLNTNQAVTCYYTAVVGTQASAGCYSDSQATTLGAMQNVAWGDNVGNGSNATDYREIGKLKVVCVFRGVVGTAGITTEVCPIGSPRPTNYPRGTIVGVIQGLSMPILGPGVELGNVASDQQRLILVR